MTSKGIKAVILAGGLGTRMRPYTLFLPKPMLPLGDKPVLEHQLDWLKKHGIRDVVIAVEYMRRIIEDYFGDGQEFGVRLTYARAQHPMGTAGQLKTAEKLVKQTFVCIYSDTVMDLDLAKLVAFHKSEKSLATIVLKKYSFPLKYGFIDLDNFKQVKSWREKPVVEGLVNVGCYVMEPEFFRFIPEKMMFGMDQAFILALNAGKKICGFTSEGTFFDIGDKKAYKEAYRSYLDKLGKIL